MNHFHDARFDVANRPTAPARGGPILGLIVALPFATALWALGLGLFLG
ncbi:MAG: hypothetical protein WC729_26140 [Sphingomonas sp.]|jgi:hypothetical protein